MGPGSVTPFRKPGTATAPRGATAPEATADQPFVHLVDAIGSDGFGLALIRFASSIAPIDKCTAFVYGGAQRPDCLFVVGSDPLQDAQMRRLSVEFLAGDWQEDPNPRLDWSAPVGPVRMALNTTAEMVPNPFRTKYYDQPNIRQEVTFLTRKGERFLYLSLFRGSGREALAADMLDRFEACGNAMVAALAKHAEMAELRRVPTALAAGGGRSGMEETEAFREIRAALLRAPGALSSREADVCALSVLGLTTSGIALTYGVSNHTITTYRKRAYLKLRISCQNELRAVCFEGFARGLGSYSP